MTACPTDRTELSPNARPPESGDTATSAEGISPRRATFIVALIGVIITLSVSWTAWTLNRHNEHRLLEVQTRQAAEVLSSSILTLRDPLETVLQIESATGGDAEHFEQFGASNVGAGRPFASASLWRKVGSSWIPISTVGEPPLLAPDSARTLLDEAVASPNFVVRSVHSSGSQRISYTIADHDDPTLAIYAERTIPANREVPVENGSAFSDLDYATYLGPTTSLGALATTDLPLSELPVSGDTVRASIPFGNSSVTLITAPRGPLGGTLGGALPWIFLVGGVALTAATAFVTNLLVSRRRKTWRDSRTISDLYLQLDALYGEQRSISETLQQALLPQQNPPVPNLEIASRYLAGADGVQIGGDWFSIIDLEHRRFAFAVGDVSGKGVGAAAIMARLRFMVRAYLTEGHAPEMVLGMCSRQLSVNRDGHLATVLVGVGDVDSGTITVANAGHLNPLVLAEGSAAFTRTNVGLPLGVAPTTYASSTIQLAPGSALVVYTDGLVERRGESLDAGMERLARSAARPHATLDDFLTSITDPTDDGASDDDIAILAFRWTPPT